MSQREVTGVFYAHGGRVFGFFQTNKPYDIPGCSALMRKARSHSSPRLGDISLQLVEDPSSPDLQAFAVVSNRRGISRREFEQAVRQIFGDSKFSSDWITNFSQHDGQLFSALLVKELLKKL